jgi:hypothetical protein
MKDNSRIQAAWEGESQLNPSVVETALVEYVCFAKCMCSTSKNLWIGDSGASCHMTCSLAVLAATKDGAIGSCLVKEILAHLQATYTTVRVSDVNRELDKLNDSFIPNRPIEEYWSKINGVVAFAKKPTDAAVITAILKLFEHYGHFPTECKVWRLLPNARLLLCQAVTSLFPVAKLKKPNFPPVAPVKMGYVIIGFAYDTDQKLETYGIPNGTICCKLSAACRTYMEAVKAAFLAQYAHVIMGEAL